MDEIKLIKKCQKHDNNAFDILYKKYSPLIYGICLRYLKDEEEAKDIMQDCFLKILKKIDKYSFNGSFEGWLRQLTINTIINYYRQEKQIFKSRIIDEIIKSETNEEIENIEKIELMSAEQILNLINLLPPKYKIVFNLATIENIKFSEISKLLGIGEATARSINKRAKDSLIKKINENNNERF